MMLMTSAALAAVDHTVYEAAGIDGATRWQQFIHITLPLISRSTYISWILMTIFCVNDFPTIYLLTAGGPVDATTSLVVLAYRTVFQDLQTGPGVAIAFFMTLVLVIISTILYRQIREGGYRMSTADQVAAAAVAPPNLSTSEPRPRRPRHRGPVVAIRRTGRDQPHRPRPGLRHRAVAVRPSSTSGIQAVHLGELHLRLRQHRRHAVAVQQPRRHPGHRRGLGRRRRPSGLRLVPRTQQSRLRLLPAVVRDPVPAGDHRHHPALHPVRPPRPGRQPDRPGDRLRRHPPCRWPPG